MFNYPKNIETNEQKRMYLESLVSNNQFSTEDIMAYIKELDDPVTPE
jgi:hypothetical protein